MSVLIYHIRDDLFVFDNQHRFFFKITETYSFKTSIQSILFLNRFLNMTKNRYWSTELKLADFVWVLRKICHLIELFKLSTIVYIDHDVVFEIAKQTNFITSSIDKLNLRFVKISEYIQRFFLIIQHKFDKLHIVLDALFGFLASSCTAYSFLNKKLDVLFTTFITEMSKNFKERTFNEYVANQNWQKIIKICDFDKKNNIHFSFEKIKELIYRKKLYDETSFFLSKKMCVSNFMIDNILKLIYNEKHFDFDRIYKWIFCSWYIRNLIDHFKCNINCTRQHKLFDNLQSILYSLILFHIWIIDFILTLSNFYIDLNVLMSIIYKFNKRIIVILEKNIWKISD